MNNELHHYGVKGQKWGVRRYQNKNGTLTSAGKKRYNLKEANPDVKRNLVIAGASIATVAACAYYVHKNPERIGQAMSVLKGVKLKDIQQKTIDKGKTYVKQTIQNAKDDAKASVKGTMDGIREGVREAPKKAAKTVVTGVVLNETKKALDSAVGKEESAKIFQANDNKKIGKFWKVSPEDKDDD